MNGHNTSWLTANPIALRPFLGTEHSERAVLAGSFLNELIAPSKGRKTEFSGLREGNKM